VDDQLSLQRIARVIRNADADAVALQEVDQGCGRSERILQVKELEKLTGYYGVFGKAIDFDGGEYGQAILSRWPIKQTAIHPLPNEQQSNGSMREQRIVLEAIVSCEIGTIRFLSTHLDHSKEDLREKQARAVDELLDRVSFPEAKSMATVLAGDFNDVPKSKSLGCFDQRWLIDPRKENLALATYPSQSPRTRIDYVAVNRSGKLVLDSLEVLPETLASDHRPVLAELVIP
jgi:endonuclease/exonuclease/phosphatase family metal-dependent hydrolase